MSKVNIKLISRRVKRIISRLKKAGFEAYIVGGAARDLLMNRKPHDWDITTNALPTQVKECFSNFPVLDTGLKHGTVMLLYGGGNYEITTYRVDGEYSDNRHPNEVSFTPNLVDDLARRDFTINAMAIDADGEIVDPFDGQGDLQRRYIRAVGEPAKRLNEDGLRILRALRFASRFGFSIDQQTKEAILAQRELLNNISYDRISSEFKGILLGDSVENILLEFRDVIAVFIPEIKDTFNFEQHNPHHKYDVYQHIVSSVQNSDHDLIVRLAMFFHDIGKPHCYSIDKNGVGHFYGHAKESSRIAEHVLKRLLFDNDTIKKVVQLVGYHDATITPKRKFVLKMLNKMGDEQFLRLLQVNRADISAQSDTSLLSAIDATEEVLQEVLESEAVFKVKHLAINGYDLIKLGIEPGIRIGELLNLALEAVINGLENDKKTLLNYVQKKI